jgi:hypothetical protein
MEKKFILTDEHRQNAFGVPDGYFEAMQDRLSERIAAKNQPQQGWWKAVRPQLAFAASFVILMVAGYTGIHLLNNLQGIVLDAVQDDTYVYVVDILNIDENTVLDLMSEERNQHDSSVETDAIIHYLADARISLADIASLD